MQNFVHQQYCGFGGLKGERMNVTDSLKQLAKVFLLQRESFLVFFP